MLPSTEVNVELYVKPGCRRCEEVADLLDALRPEVPIRVRVTNIMEDEALWARYRYRVPLVCINGEECFALQVSAEELRSRFLAPRHARSAELANTMKLFLRHDGNGEP
ncbi:MAG: glutaredoxin family protein [Myxococcaceae bacterium]